MTQSHELAHLELLAEVDALAEELRLWSESAPPWRPARAVCALVDRLRQRADMLRVRLDAPLVVAMLGGSGTGKSALVNALVGREVVQTGRQRPTTQRPTLVCRPDITPAMLGIDPATVDVRPTDAPALADLVLVDCPDPDTAESGDAPGSNLWRLRQLLPHCDVLLVTTTQQKYRSARVAKELAAAAPGARLVLVQTHADEDQDIRDDWREVLQSEYATGHVFLVDSLRALADAQSGRAPEGEMAELVDLLTRQLAGVAASRIRRANFLDLTAQTLDACRRRLDQHVEAVNKLREAIERQRAELAAPLARETRNELLASRRLWENRIIGRITAHWGFSPWSLVLRAYQGVGGLVAGALLTRVRSPAQLALWGAMQGTRALRNRQADRAARSGIQRSAAACWDMAQLRSAALVVDGYAAEAEVDRQAASPQWVMAEAEQAGTAFAGRVGAELDSVIDRQADRHSGLIVRAWYELLLLAVLGLLLYRLGRNYFWDSWLSPDASAATPVYGLEFYLSSLFWLGLWCGLLLWAFTRRVRRGLKNQIGEAAERWAGSAPADGVFARLEDTCQQIDRFRGELTRLTNHVATLRAELALPEDRLGRRRA